MVSHIFNYFLCHEMMLNSFTIFFSQYRSSSRGSSQAIISETEFGKCNGFRIVATRERRVEITTRTG